MRCQYTAGHISALLETVAVRQSSLSRDLSPANVSHPYINSDLDGNEYRETQGNMQPTEAKVRLFFTFEKIHKFHQYEYTYKFKDL